MLSVTPAKPSLWCFPVELPRLERGEIHVWRTDLNEQSDGLQSFLRVLNETERTRAERFHFKKDRDRFVIARGILRMILGRYLYVEPERLQICYGPHGKPALADVHNKDRLYFNVSHSHSLTLYAMARERELGIDVEYVRQGLAIESIARQVCSPGEIEKLLKLPPNQRNQAFFNCWTRKEAYVKAVGKGLAFPLDQLEVSFAPNESAALLRESGKIVSGWSLRDLSPGPGYVAAIAIEL
jgi:4'-phosphopantetheinyl transferase